MQCKLKCAATSGHANAGACVLHRLREQNMETRWRARSLGDEEALFGRFESVESIESIESMRRPSTVDTCLRYLELASTSR